jgi:hypothetical protein
VSGHDPLDLTTWQRIRQYAVPPRMIEESTKARESGDWRAACAAADVDIAFDPDTLRKRFGAADTARLEAELHALAPDLMRWHLPRALGGYTTLATGSSLMLSPSVKRVKADTPVLVVRMPPSVRGSQRLVLDVVAATAELPDVAPYRWDARAAADLRIAVGGSADRVPRFTSHGTTLPRSAWGVGDDPAARTERVMVLLDDADYESAWAASGVDLSLTRPTTGNRWHDPHIDRLAPVNPVTLAIEARRLAGAHRAQSWTMNFGYHTRLRLDLDRGTLRARIVEYREQRWRDLNDLPAIMPATVRRSPDLDLIWTGRMTPADLHPLVRDALFPAATETHPADDPAPAVIRVRCRGEWHRVHHTAGRLTIDHTPADVQRERVLRALGGTPSGCFAADQAWITPGGRLPKALRARRGELWQRMLHGGTRTVMELLDAGMDPHFRDGRGVTLLHLLRTFDHTVLLPRLLAAGADVNVRDNENGTPLFHAVTFRWPSEIVRALVDAGADLHGPNQYDRSVVDYIDQIMEYREDDDVDPDYLAAIAYVRERA